MDDYKNDILDFWFKKSSPTQWFQKNSDFDNDIRDRFETVYHDALNGMYDSWKNDSHGCLALIILFDQFPRNMFRDTPKMFATDSRALDIARHIIDMKFDQTMTLHEKVFSYLPFEHSENIDDQLKSLDLFKSTQAEDPNYYDYAMSHYDVIKQFGRFPHRNKVLGRENTPEENEYLAQPNSGF